MVKSHRRSLLSVGVALLAGVGLPIAAATAADVGPTLSETASLDANGSYVNLALVPQPDGGAITFGALRPERYTPAVGTTPATWTKISLDTASNPYPGFFTNRSGYATVPLAGGKALFIGGSTPGFEPLPPPPPPSPDDPNPVEPTPSTAQTTVEFDGVDFNKDRSAPIVDRFSGHTATLISGGRILLVGGDVNGAEDGSTPSPATVTPTNKVEIYNIATDDWAPGPDLPANLAGQGPAGVSARTGHQAVLLKDGRVLVLGGLMLDQGQLTPVRTTAIYTPEASGPGSWTAGPPLLEARSPTARAATLTDGSVIVAGGSASFVNESSGSEILAPGGTWQIINRNVSRGVDSFVEGGLPIVALPGGKAVASSHVRVFDPAPLSGFPTGRWNRPPNDADFDPPYSPTPTAPNGRAAVALSDGRVMFAGGDINAGFPFKRVYLFESAQAPQATLTTPADGAYLGRDQSVASSFSCVARGAALKTVDGCTMTITPPAPGTPVTLSTSGASIPTALAGVYTVTVTATDDAGLSGTATGSYTVAGKPTGTIVAPSAGRTVALNSAIASDFDCTFLAAPPTSTQAESCTATVTPPLGAAVPLVDGDNVPTTTKGTYTITVTATDKIGQTATATSTYIVSNGPGVDVTSPAPGTVASIGAELPVRFACTSGGSPVATCAAAVTAPGASSPTPVADGAALPTGAAGVYTILLSATDDLGQTNTLTRTYEVVAPPTAKIQTPVDGSELPTGRRLTAAFSCASPASQIVSCAAQLSLPGGSDVAVTPGRTLPTTTAGKYTLELTATDAAGQTRKARASYTVIAPPTITIDQPGSNVRFERGTKTPVTYSCTSEGSTVTTCTAVVTTPDTAPKPLRSGDNLPVSPIGDYAVAFTATDALGQTVKRTRRYTIDNCKKAFAFELTQVTTKGCFTNIGTEEDPVYETSDAFLINGVPIPALPGGAKAVATPPTTAKPGGRLEIAAAPIKIGDFTVYSGRIAWDLPEGGAGDEETVARLETPRGTLFQGLRVRGSVEMKFGRTAGGDYYATFPMQIELPEQFTTSPGGGLAATGEAAVRVDRKGVYYDGAKLSAENVWVGKLKVDEVCMSYVPAGSSSAVSPCPASSLNGEPFITCNSDTGTARWNGNATITLPTENETQLSVFGGLADGRVSSLGGIVKGLGKSVPLYPNVYLNQVGVGLCLTPPPFKLKGSVGVAILPTKKANTVEVDGSVQYTDGFQGQPWELEMAGSVGVLGQQIGKGSVTFRPTGLIDFGVQAGFKVSVLEINGKVGGFIDFRSGRFNVDGEVRICVSGPCARAVAVLSSVAAAGCIDLGKIKIPYPAPADDWEWYAPWRITIKYVEVPLRAGAGVKWSGKVSIWAGSCDLGEYREPRPTSRSFRAMAAGGPLQFDVKAGEPTKAIRVIGRDGPPSVVVRGPDGTTITSPTTSTGGAQEKGKWMLAMNPDDKSASILLINPKPGVWTVVKGAGSETPLKIETADYSPPPMFKGTITTAATKAPLGQKFIRIRRDQRRLSVGFSAAPGSTVELVEENVDGSLTGKIASRLRGGPCGNGAPAQIMGNPLRCAQVAFTPTEGPGGPRRIYAVVTNANGTPRSKDLVAQYVAPPQVLPSAVRNIRVRRTAKRRGVVVTWTRSVPAKWHAITVRLSTGQQFGVRVDKCTSVHIPGVTGSVAVDVQIAGVRSDMSTGRTVRAKRLGAYKRNVGAYDVRRSRPCATRYIPIVDPAVSAAPTSDPVPIAAPTPEPAPAPEDAPELIPAPDPTGR